MEGFDEEWQEVGNQRSATYTNLNPGTYTFRVKAANPDGVWNEEGTSIKLVIHPPWYWSWYSKTAYILILLGIVWYFIRDLQQKVKQKEAQLAKEQAHSQELSELSQANQKFVPTDFLQILGKESIKELKLGDQIHATMTILFADIRSYTGLSETMSPDDNFKFINGFLGRVGPVIKKHGGFINNYMGDGLMALFKEDHQVAVRAAIEVQQVLQQYNQERIAKKRRPIRTGIGLNTGELMLGIIGHQQRFDSSVISDAVNTASRMEGLTKVFGSDLIISELTLEASRDADGSLPFACRPLGKVRVKGKQEAIKIYDVYEADLVAQRQAKATTQQDFETGLQYYSAAEFGKAADAFKRVVAANPEDQAAQYYLDKCVDFVLNDAPDDWDGVEEMVLK